MWCIAPLVTKSSLRASKSSVYFRSSGVRTQELSVQTEADALSLDRDRALLVKFRAYIFILPSTLPLSHVMYDFCPYVRLRKSKNISSQGGKTQWHLKLEATPARQYEPPH